MWRALVLLLAACAAATTVLNSFSTLGMETWHHPKGDLWAVFETPPQHPLGVLLLFHGCTHNAEDWFQLPAEKLVVSEALKRGLVCVALPSADRVGSRCWDMDVDDERAEMLIRDFVRPSWPSLPIYALGASSGGSFAAWLGNNPSLALSGVALYITPGLPAFLDIKQPYPRTAMIIMKEDALSASQERAQSFLDRLTRHHVAGKMWLCEPQSFNVGFLRNHMPSWPPQLRAALIRNMRRANLLDEHGMLAKDPRALWDSHMEILESTAEQVNRTTTDTDVESLRELLNVAWGEHEMTAEHASSVLDFLHPRRIRR
jgi:hypothetical protein